MFDSETEDTETEDNQTDARLVRYLDSVEQDLYQAIEARKLIDSGLLFLSCQFFSLSLSWFLFSIQLSLGLIIAFSSLVALLPGLKSASELTFKINKELWEIRHPSPISAIAKLGLGCVFSYYGNREILKEVWATEKNFKETYSEIQEFQKQNVKPIDSGLWNAGSILVLAAIGVWVIKYNLSLHNRNNKDKDFEDS